MSAITDNIKADNPGALELKIQTALNGVQQVLPTGSSLSFDGAPLTQAQIAQRLQGFQPSFQKVKRTKADHIAALVERSVDEAAARDFLVQLRGVLVAFFGVGSPLLAQFGMPAKKKTARTAQQKVLSAAKAKLTRKKRGTLGSKQKLAVKTLGTPHVSLGANGPTVTPSAADTAQSAAANPQPSSGTANATALGPVAQAPAGTQVKS